MKWTRLLILMLILLSTTAQAQWGEEEEPEERPTFKERVFTGGGLGLNFSNYADFFSISPLLGYKISTKLAAGLSFQYRYTRYKSVSPKFSTNDFGVSPFVRYYVYAPFFLHAEYEYLNYQFAYSSGEKFRKSYGSLLVGGGLFQPLGRRAGLFIMGLYNFSYQAPSSSYDYSPYSSPFVFRAGITAGF